MQSVLVSFRRRAARAAVIVTAAALGLLLSPVPAHAHGQLAMSRPMAFTIVNDPLERVELYFTEKPAPDAHFTITGPNGGRVDNGWSAGQPLRLDKPVQEYFLVDGQWQPRVYNTGFPAIVAVAHWPMKGQYTVAYLSVASDGEVVRGTIKFDYNGSTTTAPAGWSPATNGPSPTLLEQVKGGQSSSSAGAAPAPAGAPTETADPGNTPRAAASPPDGNPAVWLPPAILVAAAALVIGHAARKPPLPKPVRRRKQATAQPESSSG